MFLVCLKQFSTLYVELSIILDSIVHNLLVLLHNLYQIHNLGVCCRFPVGHRFCHSTPALQTIAKMINKTNILICYVFILSVISVVGDYRCQKYTVRSVEKRHSSAKRQWYVFHTLMSTIEVQMTSARVVIGYCWKIDCTLLSRPFIPVGCVIDDKNWTVGLNFYIIMSKTYQTWDNLQSIQECVLTFDCKCLWLVVWLLVRASNGVMECNCYDIFYYWMAI